MLAEEAMFSILSDSAGVVALVGDRIYPGVLPQELTTYPALTFRVVGRETIAKLETPGVVELVKKTFMIYNCNQGTGKYGPAKLLAAAVIVALEGFVDTVENGMVSPVATIVVQRITANGEYYDAYDDKTKTFQTVVGFEVWAEEPLT